MKKTDFNRDWQFAKSDVDWPEDLRNQSPEMEAVILPHTWNADDMVVGSTESYVGPGWYHKIFTLPALEAGQRVLLETEGATNCHKVWVNDGYAGGRNGGFLPTLMDITDLLESGENTILVRVDNTYDLVAAMPGNIDWNRYGGITRPVWLHVREHAYLKDAGVEVMTPSVSKEEATTVVRSHVQEEGLSGSDLEIRHTLLGPDGEQVSVTAWPMQTQYSRTNTVEVGLPTVDSPQLWSDTNPVLYTLVTEVLEDGVPIDRREDRIGYRYIRFDPNDGFLLNGKPTELRGANIHIFFPGLGNAVPERFHRSEMALMKRMGCNYMRTSHYPRPKACLDACDELGILVLEEQPYWHGSLRAVKGEAAVDNCVRLIQDMVRHHRNHPSIIAWNTVNEVMLAPAYKPGEGHLEPSDPRRVAWGINPKEYPYIRRHLQKMVDTFKEEDPDRPVSMVVGSAWQKNDDAGLSSLGDIVAYNGGALNFKDDFVGPKTGKHYEFRPDYYRELYPNRVHMMSEGILNDVCFERGDWEQEAVAWRSNARYWDAFGARSWFCGGSMWCFTDYSANGLIRLHGAVDLQRLEKDLFHFYEAMWSDHPVLHILGHWNHETGTIREVVVFTNCTDVELTLNGRSLDKGKSTAGDFPHINHAPLIWTDIPFEPGQLKVDGTFDGQDISDVRNTAGATEKIQLCASNTELLADGRDISYVDVTARDFENNRCYLDRRPVSVTVTGAAVLAGPSEVTLHAGLARFAIRSNGLVGDVTVSVAADGLTETSFKLTCN